MSDSSNPVPSGKIHHVPAPSRDMEAAEHGVKPHCLDKPPRAKGYPIATAWGQHHVGEDGTRQTGVSRTESAAALRGGKLPTDPPVIGKKLSPAPVTWGNRSVGAEQHDASGAQANKILQDAVEASGPDHPVRMAQLAQLAVQRGELTMAAQHDYWRNLKKGADANFADKSTGAILDRLKTPRDPKVVTAHEGVASVSTDGGTKPTMPRTDDGNTEANAKFNQATKGPTRAAQHGHDRRTVRWRSSHPM